MKESRVYRYEMIAKNEENPDERQLAELAAEVVAIKLQLDDVPQIFFIKEAPNGYIKYSFRINGYCASGGKYICLRHGRAPMDVVKTAIHEMRHVYQALEPKWIARSTEMAEQDARLFEIEFWGSHSNNGDAPTLTRTLNEILNDDLDRLWKKACASARAKLSLRPAETESSDDLRRRFVPVLKARPVAVQQFVDPNGQRLFPPGIEFSAPCVGLKVSY